MSHAPTLETWLEFVVPLAIGVAVIVFLAVIIARQLRNAAWRRIAWQVSTLAIAILLASELTGVSSGVLNWSVERLSELRKLSASRRTDDLADVDDHRRDWTLEETRVPDRSTEFSSLLIVQGIDTEMNAARQEPRPPIVFGSEKTPGQQNLVTWWPAIVWLTGTMLLLGRLLIGWMLLVSVRWRNRVACDDSIHERVQAIARRLGIGRRVDVVVASGLCGPIAFGAIRPTVGLPLRFADQFDRPQQEAMLAHELGHLAAHDPAWQMLADVVGAAMWWHPLAWWSRHELRSASELAADEASLAIPDGPASLAACLVALGGHLVRRRPVGWTAIEGNGFRSSLGRRVARLLDMPNHSRQQPRSTSSGLFRVVGPAAIVAVALSCTAWSRPQGFQKGDSMSQFIRHSWRQSLAAVTIVSLFGAVETATLADDPPETPSKAAPDPFAPVDEAAPGEKLRIKVIAQKEKPSKEPRAEKEKISDEEHAKIVQAKERLDQLEREIEKLRSAGRTDQAEKLAAEYKELRGALEVRYEKKGEKSAEAGDDLKARLKALESENARLRELLGGKEKGKGEEQRDPKGKYPPAKSPPEKPVSPKVGEAEQGVQIRLKELQGEIAELLKAGRKEEAEKLAAAARDLAEHAKHAQYKRGEEFVPPPEVREKLEVAAKEAARLQEVGKHEEANVLRRKLQEAQNDYKRKLVDRGYAPPGAESNELGQVINQLREEVNRLREEVNDLRRAMKERGDDKPVDKRPR